MKAVIENHLYTSTLGYFELFSNYTIQYVFLDQNPENALQETLHRRNQKTTAYKTGGIILCIGLVLYCISIALMLLDPAAIQGPVR